MGVAFTTFAQIYLLDDNFADSAQVYQVELCSDGKTETLGDPAFKLPMGQTVTVKRLLEGQTAYGLVEIDGQKYAMSSGELLFSDENPEGVEDTFGNTRERVNHSLMGKFFATMLPYWIIAILFVVSMAFVWLGFKVATLRRVALIVVPGCILAASLLEVWAYSVLGMSAFWWCNPDKYGFFGALFRVIPFIVFVAFQLFSIKLYMRLITNESDNDLSIKPMLISIGVCIPVSLVVLFVCAGCFDMKSPWTEIVFVASFLISLGIGIFISFRRNIKELGKAGGLAFSLFGIAWSIGAVVAVAGLIMVIFKLIIQILLVVGAILGVAFAMGNGKGSSPEPHQMMFRDDEGRLHTNGVDRDSANRRIAERKSNDIGSF